MIFGLVRMWLHDLLRHMPTGHNDLCASENVKVRNSEFPPWNFLWKRAYCNSNSWILNGMYFCVRSVKQCNSVVVSQIWAPHSVFCLFLFSLKVLTENAAGAGATECHLWLLCCSLWWWTHGLLDPTDPTSCKILADSCAKHSAQSPNDDFVPNQHSVSDASAKMNCGTPQNGWIISAATFPCKKRHRTVWAMRLFTQKRQDRKIKMRRC